MYSGGLKIFSAQDEHIQKICDEEFANPANFPSGTEVGVDYALTVTDPQGQVTNYGNESLKDFMLKKDPSFNMMFPDESSARTAIQEYRQSVLKSGDTVEGSGYISFPAPGLCSHH